MKRFALFLSLFVCLALASAVFAQRGGNGGGGRGNRTPDPNATRPAFPTRDPNATPRAIPTDWSSLTLPTGLPSQAEIQAIIDEYDLPFDLESLDLPASSPEAYSALVAFGQTYLGLSAEPLYAGTLDTTTLGSRRGQLSQEIPVEISATSGELPPELQSILANASGVTYYGIYETGAASVYTASECTAANCSVTMDNLQITLTSGSLGVYSFYTQAQVSDANTAQALILNTFPALTAYPLTAASTTTGYAFTGTGYADGVIVAFVAGVVPAQNGQALVYVSYGLGEAYVSILR